jgi:hypothetical protein
MGHGAGAALLGYGLRRLDLALIIDGQNHGMGRRVDIQTDDVAHLGRKLRAFESLNSRVREAEARANARHAGHRTG